MSNQFTARPALVRLLENFTVNLQTDCWEWQGSRNEHEYGWILVDKKKVKTHRLAYIAFIGPIPINKPNILHSCDNPPCFFPEHLWAGTQAENIEDMIRKGRGHAPTGEKNGARLHPERMARGSQSGAARLTETQVIEIRSRTDLSLRAAGNIYKVSHHAIWAIRSMKTWQHVR